MATDIVLRSVKAASLTHAEMDQNWESLAQTVDAVTANVTVAVTDQNKILEVSISTGTITLPTVANAAGTDTDSFKITIKNINATSLTVDGNGAETIEGAASVTLLENEAAEFTLSSGAAEWNITGFYNPNLIGITSTAAELNKLDGATASTTELNYVTGVTSAIQTQLNARQPLDADLTAIAALANTNSNFIVGNGSAWVAETGATARTSLGVDAAGTDNSTDVTLAGTPNYLTLAGQVITRVLISLTSHITGILPVANGGTNSSTASGARTSLGLGALAVLNTVSTSVIDALAVTDAKIALPGSLKKIAVGTASSSAELAFTSGLDSTYNKYVFVMVGILPATNAAELYYQGSTNGGSTYLGTNNYEWELREEFMTSTADETNRGTLTSFASIARDNSNNAIYGIDGKLTIYEVASTVRNKKVVSRLHTYDSSSSAYKNSKGQSAISTTSAVNAVRFYFNTGNIASGTITLYGVVK